MASALPTARGCAIVGFTAILSPTFSQGKGNVGNSYRGAAFTAEYVGTMVSYPGPWNRAAKAFFIQRAIEAGRFANGRINTVMEFSREEQRKLKRLFPELSKNVSEPTPGSFAEMFEAAHPFGPRVAKPFVDDGGRFLGAYESPARYLYVSGLGRLGGHLSVAEWNHALRVLKKGAQWESKHSDYDFGLDPEAQFIRSLRNQFPGIRLRQTITGIRVTEMWRAVRAAHHR